MTAHTSTIRPEEKVAQVFEALGNLAGQHKFGDDSATIEQMALLSYAADQKVRQLTGKGLFTSVYHNVLENYGNRQGFDALVSDAKGVNPKPKTVQTFAVFAKKIKTHIGQTAPLKEAFDEARAEHPALSLVTRTDH